MTTTKSTAESYSPEVWERAVRLVLDGAGEHPTQEAAISSVAAKIGLHDGDAAELDAPKRA
jgi:transposase-like protein